VRRLVPIVLRPWTLPLIVAALVLPSVAGFALVGPQLGLAVGALTATALIVVAARARYDEPIEVAVRPDQRYRLLVVAAQPISEPTEAQRIAAIAAEGNRALGSDGGEPEILVLAPAIQGTLDRWASDVRKARDRAQEVLAVSLGTLTAAGLDVRGSVGDADAVQAIEDELRTFPAQEVAVSGLSAEDANEVGRRLDRPVRRLSPAGAAPEPEPHLRQV
jgi:hypothetical protein